jgi:putative phosphoesterase
MTPAKPVCRFYHLFVLELTMLLGILSDTHDHPNRTRRAVDLLQSAGAQALVHCGDLNSPAIVRLLSGLPSWFVFGNNDVLGRHDVRAAQQFEAVAEEVGAVCLQWGGIIELSGKRIAVTHGHQGVEERRLLAVQPDYLLTGHTHERHDRRVGPTRLINPGALHRVAEFTVALLNLSTDELQFLAVPRAH